MPSNDEDAAGAAVLTVDCTAPSGAPVVAPGKPWRGRSFFGCAASSLFGEIVARRGETSFLEDRMTVTPPGSFATAGSGIVSVSASASATTVVALSIPLLPHRDAGWLRGRDGMARWLSCHQATPRLPGGALGRLIPRPAADGGRGTRVDGGFRSRCNSDDRAREAQDGTLIAGAPRALAPRGWLSATLALASPPKVRRWTHEPPVTIAAE